MGGAQLNQAKEILAFELTKLVHGEEEAQKAQDAAKALFAQGGDKSNVPTTTLDTGDLTDGAIGVLELMLKCGLVPPRRRLAAWWSREGWSWTVRRSPMWPQP